MVEYRAAKYCIGSSKPAFVSSLLSVAGTNRPDDFKRREDLAGQLNRQYGVACEALMTSNTIIMKAPTAETPNIMKYLTRPILRARASELRAMKLPKPTKVVTAKSMLFEHVAMLNAYDAHRVTRGERSLVAIVDSGVDYEHPDLRDNFGDEKGYDFVRGAKDPQDGHGHGTHVAGIVKSLAPDVSLMALRVLNENGSGTEADVLLAYEWCYKRNIPVINCSLGSSMASDEERAVVQAAPGYGCLIVAAAGNESRGDDAPDVEGFPAWFPGVQSIASVNSVHAHSYFSNMGKVEFSALGENVISTLAGGGYGQMTGTSMACPCVSGAFALQHSASPESSLEDRLLRAASRCNRDFGEEYASEEWDRRFGFGIPDCARWVE